MENLPEKIPEKNFIKNATDWLQERDRLEDICVWIENGGSLITMCDILEIKYSTVMRWVNAQPERSKAYNTAIEARKELMVESLVNELRSLCFTDIRKAFDDNGNLLSPCDMPDDIAKAIAAVEIDDEGKSRIRLWDKLAAIEKLGKNLKMFIDRVEHTGTVTLEEMVAGTLTNDTEKKEQ